MLASCVGITCSGGSTQPPAAVADHSADIAGASSSFAGTEACSSVRGSCARTSQAWDAVYVALAEALDATLITLDERLGRVEVLACRVHVVTG